MRWEYYYGSVKPKYLDELITLLVTLTNMFKSIYYELGPDCYLMSFLKVQVRPSKKISKTTEMIIRSRVDVPALGTIPITILSKYEREHVAKLKLKLKQLEGGNSKFINTGCRYMHWHNECYSNVVMAENELAHSGIYNLVRTPTETFLLAGGSNVVILQ